MKIYKLKESDLVNIIKRVIAEQETQYNYVCQPVSEKSTNIKDLPEILKIWGSYEKINEELNKRSQLYMSKLGKNSTRAACEISLVQIRPNYKDKNLFVIDGLNNFIYLFDKDSNFVISGEILKGQTKQSEDAAKIAKALVSYKERVKSLGLVWDGYKYVKKDNPKKTYSEEEVFDIILKKAKDENSAFLPAGIYSTSDKLVDKSNYYGGSKNLLPLKTTTGESLTQAIHGYVKTAERTNAMSIAEKLIGDPRNPKLTDEFLNALKDGLNLNLSYGCINVSANFLPYLQKYGPSSYVFNLFETEDNYLVNNTMDYFNKMLTIPQCVSPEKLGAINISTLA